MEEARSLLKRLISHTYQQDTSVSVHVPTTQAASEKVASTVATFLNEGNTESLFKRAIGYNYQQEVSESVKVITTNVASEKVTNTVGTFYSS